MDPQHGRGTALTAFDRRTAQAVVTVLGRAGIDAWLAGVDAEEAEVHVPEGRRDEALRALGARMEEVRQAAAEVDAAEARRRGDRGRAPRAAPRDPDDVHDGPPLVMERLRGMGWLLAVLLVPLLAVTLAPTLRGDVAIRAVVVVAVVVVAVIVYRRRRS